VSPATLEAPGMRASAAAAAPAEARLRLAPAAGGRRATLEELLDRTLRTAQVEAEAECPLCHGPIRMEAKVARCGGCGSALA
jgi:hypothetical protein